MKALSFGMVLVGIVVVSACGSATPASDCNHAAETICHRFFQCAATQASQTYGTESSCVTTLETQINCAALVCPANTTYHDDKINACIGDVNAQSCSDTSTPPACTGFTTGSVCY